MNPYDLQGWIAQEELTRRFHHLMREVLSDLGRFVRSGQVPTPEQKAALLRVIADAEAVAEELALLEDER